MNFIKCDLPIKGINKGVPPDQSNRETSGYMNNVRSSDINEDQIRIGQRPGVKKWGAGTLIGAAEQPVVALVSVSSLV